MLIDSFHFPKNRTESTVIQQPQNLIPGLLNSPLRMAHTEMPWKSRSQPCIYLHAPLGPCVTGNCQWMSPCHLFVIFRECPHTIHKKHGLFVLLLGRKESPASDKPVENEMSEFQWAFGATSLGYFSDSFANEFILQWLSFLDIPGRPWTFYGFFFLMDTFQLQSFISMLKLMDSF